MFFLRHVSRRGVSHDEREGGCGGVLAVMAAMRNSRPGSEKQQQGCLSGSAPDDVGRGDAEGLGKTHTAKKNKKRYFRAL